MKIIEDIINEIADKSAHLTSILMKTKILAFNLKNQELKDWVEYELNGYPDDNLPEYRIVHGEVIAYITDGVYSVQNYHVSVVSLDKKNREWFSRRRLQDSISKLENAVQQDGNKNLSVHVPHQLYHLLSKDFSKGYEIQSARIEINHIDIVRVLVSVRSKLLDFLLQLNEEIGDKEDLSALTSTDGYSTLFKDVVFNQSATITIGHHNKQETINITITNGNFGDLKELLLSNGMSENDIKELESIIDKDNPDIEKKVYGTKVKKWIQKMFSKAVDRSWNIGIGAAGQLLAEGIAKYYGWK